MNPVTYRIVGDFQLYVCGDCPELGGSTAPEKVKRSGIPLEATDSRGMSIGAGYVFRGASAPIKLRSYSSRSL